jgi:hypothetical protein
MLPIIQIFKGAFVAYVSSTIKNKDSAKAKKVRAIVTEIAEACGLFLATFAEEE